MVSEECPEDLEEDMPERLDSGPLDDFDRLPPLFFSLPPPESDDELPPSESQRSLEGRQQKHKDRRDSNPPIKRRSTASFTME
jgi:hypothetical protein